MTWPVNYLPEAQDELESFDKAQLQFPVNHWFGTIEAVEFESGFELQFPVNHWFGTISVYWKEHSKYVVVPR